MAKASTCPDVGELQKLASGHLPASQVETLVGHLETCAPCLAKVQTLTPDDTLVSSLSLAREQAEGQDAEFVARIISKLKKLSAAPAASGTITVACTHCGKTLKTKAALAGKKVKCPGCGQACLTPAAAALSSVADDRTLAPRDTPSSFAPVAHAHGPSIANDHTEAGEHSGAEDAWDFLAPPQAADEIGRLGGYRILKVLGRGGMGVVFRAEDPSLKRIVALKAMLPSLAASPSAKKRFLREAQTAASIKHDHIVTIHQVGEDRGAPFLAMEFLHGEPLDVRLKRESKLPIPEVLRIGREVAEGLAAAHDEGLIHRDIKPANIWLETRGEGRGARGEPQGPKDHKRGMSDVASSLAPRPSSLAPRVKILDFGLARSTDDQAGLTQTGAIIGTPAYMAPEQGQGADVDHRCDLFSLGCMIYVMATGQLPFKGKDTISTLMSIATDEAPAPRSLNPETPQGLSDFIGRLLAKKPEQRPASAHEVVAVLHALEANDGEQTATLKRLETPPAKKPKAPGPKSRRGLLVACGLGLVAAAVLVAGIVLFLPTANGVVRIEINDDDIEVVLTKTGATFKGKGKQPDLSVAPGEHMFKVKRGDLEFETDKLVLKKGETVTLKVEFLQGKLHVAQADGKIIGESAAKPKSADPAAERRVAEWVLGKKGRLKVRVRGTPFDVNRPDELPKDPFTILEVNLAMGGNFNAEQIFNDDLRQLALLVNLEYLNLGRQPVTADGLAHLTGLGELRGLILYSGTVGLDAIPVVAKFTKLEHFMFPSEKSDAWAAALAKIPTLRYVNGYRSDITDAGVIHLARLPKLEELILDDCGGTTDASLKALASCKSLRTLVLPPDIGQPGRMTWAEVARLQKAQPDCDIQPKLPKVTADPAAERRAAEWVLGKKGFVTIRKDGAEQVVNVTKLGTTIDKLPAPPFTIVGVNLSPTNAETLEINDLDLRQLACLKQLETLDLNRQPISTAGFAHLSGNSELKALFIYSTRIGLDAIPMVGKLDRLEKFMFPGGDIPGCDKWAEVVSKLPRMREVTAYRCDLSDAGLSHLARMPNLEKLSIDDCTDVTDAGLKILASCRSLRKLQIGNTKITLGEAQKFAQALPECEVTFLQNGAFKKLPNTK